MDTQNFSLACGQNKIVGRVAFPPTTPCPAIILLHGFTNTAEDCPINRDMFKLLPQKGYAVVEFDFYGGGKSNGQFKDKTLGEMYKNYLTVLNYIKKDKKITSIGVVGKSIKGIFPIMSNDPRVKTIALLSTAVKPTNHFYRIWDKKKRFMDLYFGKSQNPKVQLILGQAFFTELAEIEAKVIKNLPKIKNIIHFQGTADQSVPFEQGQYYYIKNTLPQPSKSILIEGVGHQYEGKEKFVIDEILRWFKKFL